MKANKGFTLLEIAVVLAVIAILAAIMTPIVTSYVDQARVTRANNDVKKIAQAILLHKRDTGAYPGFGSLADAKAGTPSFTTNIASCLISGPSSNPTLTGWTCAYPNYLLNDVLNVNTLGFSAATEGIGGQAGYRGPYLDGLSGLDPWGTPYLVNGAELKTGATNYAFAVSAGPNGTFETSQSYAKTGVFAPGGDDIVSLIK